MSPAVPFVIRASHAPVIVNGSNAERFQLYMEDTGQAQRADLADVFEVQWGKHNEQFCLDWHQRVTRGTFITERQREIEHDTLPLRCTLDGYMPIEDAVIECKVLEPHTKSQDFIQYYAPQVVVQMLCRKAMRGLLLVQQGNHAPKEYDIITDAGYVDAVVERLLEYGRAVEQRVPPDGVKPPPVPPERWRTIDLLARPLPNWGHAMISSLRLWQDTKPAAGMHAQAKEDVKALLPEDVGRVFYGPVTITRSKSMSVTIKERDE